MTSKTELFQAKESFVTHVDGEQISVSRGDLVRAGHPILKGRDELFEPAEGFVRFDVEQATKAPGEKRGERKRSRRAKTAEKTSEKTSAKAPEEPAKASGEGTAKSQSAKGDSAKGASDAETKK
jgi:hypothetical protein